MLHNKKPKNSGQLRICGCCWFVLIWLMTGSCGYAATLAIVEEQPVTPLNPVKVLPAKKKPVATKNNVNLRNIPKVFHKGITIVALPDTTDKSEQQSRLDAKQALENIRKGYDYLLEHSAYAAQTIQTLRKSGPIWIFYSPSFPSKSIYKENSVTFAVFTPSFLRRADGGKSYSVIIGHHLVLWPAAELAWALGHELVGHGFQHLHNRLDYSRINDMECEAFLHQERVLQELGLWKNGDLMVKVRRQMEEKWCRNFRQHMKKTEPGKMQLWDVRNMDVPQLLKLYTRYFVLG